MDIRKLLLLALSLAIISVIPPIQGQTRTLIALRAPHAVNEALEKYADRIWDRIHKEVRRVGLEFTTVHGKDIHQTLFWGTTDDNSLLIDGAKRAIQGTALSQVNPFTDIQIGDIERFKTALAVTIQGTGDTKAKQVGDQIERYGTPDFHYLGHISIGRFKLPKTKVTGDKNRDKDTIEGILNANPEIMQEIRKISLPDIRSFTFDALMIKGTDLAERIYPIDDILKEMLAQKTSAPREQTSSKPASTSTRQPKILIALKAHNSVNETLEKYTKKISQKIHDDIENLGLEFIPTNDIHQTLFSGTTDDNALLIDQTKRAIQSISSSKINPFTGTQIGDIKRLKTALVVTIQGTGDAKAKEVGDQIEKYGTPDFPYLGHISLGRFKLTKATGDRNQDKKTVEAILEANPQVMQKITNISVPDIRPFTFDTLLIKGGGLDEKTYPINDILKEALTKPTNNTNPAPAPQQKYAQSSSTSQTAPEITVAFIVPDEIANALADYGNAIMKKLQPYLATIGLSFVPVDRTRQYLNLFYGTTDDLVEFIKVTETNMRLRLSAASKAFMIEKIVEVDRVNNFLEVDTSGPARRSIFDAVESFMGKRLAKSSGRLVVGEFKLLNQNTTDINRPQLIHILQAHPEIMQKIGTIPFSRIEKASFEKLLFRVISGNINREVIIDINPLEDFYDEDNSPLINAARNAGIIH